MSHIVLGCTNCGRAHPADMATLACRECSGPLRVEYLDRGRKASPIPTPLHDPASAVSLGEGGTPWVELAAIGALIGVPRLVAKLELLNPTGSFKDRGTAVMVSAAREHGVAEVVEDSSGNAGASVSAYAVRAGITAHIFVPAGAPAAKLRQISAYGAEVHAIEGPREAATEAAVSYYTEHGLIYASHALSPYFLEGTKSFAYELVTQTGASPPDHIVFPVGNGGLLLGAWTGLSELNDDRILDRLPRLHCVQVRSVMPIVASYDGAGWEPGTAARTVAGGIAVATPARRQQVVDALRATEGTATAVDDHDVLRWRSLLAEREGLFVEPTSAAALAGVEQLVGSAVIGAGDSVMVPLTGSGLKDMPD